MSHDTKGRPYATKAEVVEGSVIVPDGGFPCMKAGDIKIVRRSNTFFFCGHRGLYVECTTGIHLLAGQLDDTYTYYSGLYIATKEEIEAHYFTENKTHTLVIDDLRIDFSNGIKEHFGSTTMKKLLLALRDLPKKHPTFKDIDSMFEGEGSFLKILDNAFIKAYPELEGKLLHLYGHRTPFQNLHSFLIEHEYTDPVIQANVVCLIKDDIVVDLTYKQWDVDGANFYITTLEEIKKEWLVITTNIELMEPFTNINYYLSQATREWQKLAHHLSSEKLIQQNISENLVGAKMCYDLVVKGMNDDLIIFTGTEEDNIHLQKMNNYYKQQFEKGT